VPRVGQNKPPKWTTSECQNHPRPPPRTGGRVGQPTSRFVFTERTGRPGLSLSPGRCTIPFSHFVVNHGSAMPAPTDANGTRGACVPTLPKSARVGHPKARVCPPFQNQSGWGTRRRVCAHPSKISQGEAPACPRGSIRRYSYLWDGYGNFSNRLHKHHYPLW
jgi:hypothetical protein